MKLRILLSLFAFLVMGLSANAQINDSLSHQNSMMKVIDKPGVLWKMKYNDMGKIEKSMINKIIFNTTIAEDLATGEKYYWLQITTIGIHDILNSLKSSTGDMMLSEMEQCLQSLFYMNKEMENVSPNEEIKISYSTNSDLVFICFTEKDKKGGYNWACKIIPNKYDKGANIILNKEELNLVLSIIQKSYNYLQEQRIEDNNIQ